MGNITMQIKMVLKEYNEKMLDGFRKNFDMARVDYHFEQGLIDGEVKTIMVLDLDNASYSLLLSALPLVHAANISEIYGEYSNEDGANLPAILEISFENLCCLKVVELKNIILRPISNHPMFKNCNSLEKINCEIDTSIFGSLAEMFMYCFNLKETPKLDVGNCVDMNNMFDGCESLKVVNFNGVPNLKHMNCMFQNCHSLTEIPEMDTSEVERMLFTFSNCMSLKELPKLNYKNLKRADGLFNGCKNLESVPALDLSSLEDADFMFLDCIGLKSVEKLYLPKLKSASYMFGNCVNLEANPPEIVFPLPYMGSIFGNAEINGIFKAIKPNLYIDDDKNEETITLNLAK